MIKTISLTFSTTDINYILLSIKNLIYQYPDVTVYFEYDGMRYGVDSKTDLVKLRKDLAK